MTIVKNTFCPFCDGRDVEIENELAYVLYDTYPVSPGHCLIVPNRHIAEYFEATAQEKLALWTLVDEMKLVIDQKYKPDGYNIGVNVGVTAGQSVPHIHVHLIPRYKGDMVNPKGGVRGVIPHKQKYTRKPRTTAAPVLVTDA